jgi:diacylglycerol kinase (ATP)
MDVLPRCDLRAGVYATGFARGKGRVCACMSFRLASRHATVCADREVAKRMLVIANPHAGHGRGARVLAEVQRHLGERGMPHETVVSARPGHIMEISAEAVRRGDSPLVLVGGDGTLFEAVNGMAREGRFLPVAQIPVGTGNSFIKDLGIQGMEDGLAALAGGRIRHVDVGRARSPAGEFHFVNLTGAGFVANVASRAGSFKFLGDSSYTVGVLLELILLRGVECRISADGVESVRQAIFVEICNSRKTGGDMIMAPAAEVDDGLLDVIVAHAMNRRTLLKLFPLIFTGEHVNSPLVECFRCRRLTVSFAVPQRVTPDGEILGTTPLEVEVLPRALPVYTA